MKKVFPLSAVILVPALLLSVHLFFSSQTSVLADQVEPEVPVVTAIAPSPEKATAAEIVEAPFTSPISDAESRVTKKPFGLLIQTGLSPVPNDRFTGYHVGVDFETFADEQEVDVPIYAICNGRLLFKKFATGYGGVAVQECELEGEVVSIIYGHLNLASIVAEAEEVLTQGEQIGILGKGLSEETDGVRKHLHLGVHPGSLIDIRGYVQDATETSQWIDVLPYLSF